MYCSIAGMSHKQFGIYFQHTEREGWASGLKIISHASLKALQFSPLKSPQENVICETAF
jgi:hypothetical protein